MFFSYGMEIVNQSSKPTINYYCLDFTSGLYVISPGLLWILHACYVRMCLIYVFPAFHIFLEVLATRLGAILDVYLVFTYNIVFRDIFVYLEILETMDSNGQGS